MQRLLLVLLAASSAACVRTAPQVSAPTVEVPVTAVPPGPPLATLTAAEAASIPSAVADRRSPGERVDVEWNGFWYAAVLLERRADLWLVHYEGYTDDWNEAVAPGRIRARTLPVGEGEEVEGAIDP
ncbi:MAG: hypothetical protein KF819_19815 [Labilithrix sp.]|nr:hypothetical protein [Labilithrix sp.]